METVCVTRCFAGVLVGHNVAAAVFSFSLSCRSPHTVLRHIFEGTTRSAGSEQQESKEDMKNVNSDLEHSPLETRFVHLQIIEREVVRVRERGYLEYGAGKRNA